MPETVIRPSMKFIKAGYAFVIILILVAVAVHYKYLAPQEQPPWLPAIVALFIFWPVKRQLQRQAVKISILGDKLRYETGLIGKSTRIIVIPKIQDVRVVQSGAQRVFNVGDLAIETAGENSRLVVQNLDNPHQLAEQLTDASGATPQKM